MRRVATLLMGSPGVKDWSVPVLDIFDRLRTRLRFCKLVMAVAMVWVHRPVVSPGSYACLVSSAMV